MGGVGEQVAPGLSPDLRVGEQALEEDDHQGADEGGEDDDQLGARAGLQGEAGAAEPHADHEREDERAHGVRLTQRDGRLPG